MAKEHDHKEKYAFKQNRELSWLKFNERVLAEAEDDSVPLLERLRFVTIFTTNLDEFFRVRVGSLIDLMMFKKNYKDNKTGMTAKEQIDAIMKDVRPLWERRESIYFMLEQELRTLGVARETFGELRGEEQEYAVDYFQNEVSPLLSPIIIDPHHPFPHLLNKQIYLVAVLRNPEGRRSLALLPVPQSMPEVIYFPGPDVHFIAIEDLLLEMIDVVFESYEVEEKAQICITRNADIHAEDEDFDVEEDFRNVMKEMLNQRRHLAPLRLEVHGEMSDELKEYLLKHFKLEEQQLFETKAPLRYNYAYPLADKLDEQKRKALTYNPFEPQQCAVVDPRVPMEYQIADRDILLVYPYESMDPFIRMVSEAADDPDVLSIQITIYRLAKESRLMDALIRASQQGKEVSALIELRARFDEQNNIDWSDRMEKAGITIIYGIQNYKVHSKVCLITKRTRDGIRFITQVGTGNYNEKTAKIYSDMCLMTDNQDIGRDARTLFRNMGIGNLYGQYRELLVSPVSLKRRVLDMMDEEIAKGSEGRIFFKLNSLTDKEILDKISEASKAGVHVRMIIRGICCLRPGMEKYTENVEVRSIVGRYLEHPRIYCFGTDDDERIFISSADLMTRNTERRVEVGCPVYDESAKKKIRRFIDMQWRDTMKARRLLPDGTYEKIEGEPYDSQSEMMNVAIQEYEQSEIAHRRKDARNGGRILGTGKRDHESEGAAGKRKGGFLSRLFGRK
ncbi:MAG: polyphosphate kinase 1 [Anaerovoracaceae bacterium]|jgi:polyphosphate kinase